MRHQKRCWESSGVAIANQEHSMIKLGTAVGSNDATCCISGGQDGISLMGLGFRALGLGFWVVGLSFGAC